MKTPIKSKLNQAFSLVELLVVIAVIAVIAAIAIPNITGITQSASAASQQRTAQNIASLASSALAAGATAGNGFANAPTDVPTWVTALTAGVVVTNASGGTNGVFRASGVPSDTAYQNYLTFDSVSGALIYSQTTNAP